MYLHMCSLCLPPHHHQQWNPQRWAGGPPSAASIVGDDEATSITNTYADTYATGLYFYISIILIADLRSLFIVVTITSVVSETRLLHTALLTWFCHYAFWRFSPESDERRLLVV